MSACAIGSFGESLAFNSKGPIKCVSLNNQLCQDRPTLNIINSNETLLYPYILTVNKRGGSCNNIDEPSARVFVSNKVKIMILKIYNLISGVIETRYLVQHESQECKCGLNQSVCNLLQKWNHDEC